MRSLALKNLKWEGKKPSACASRIVLQKKTRKSNRLWLYLKIQDSKNSCQLYFCEVLPGKHRTFQSTDSPSTSFYLLTEWAGGAVRKNVSYPVGKAGSSQKSLKHANDKFKSDWIGT